MRQRLVRVNKTAAAPLLGQVTESTGLPEIAEARWILYPDMGVYA